MKKAGISRRVFVGVVFVLSLFMVNCHNYGKEKNYNGVQFFYTSTVTEDEAGALGAYLARSGFADGEPKSVQLNKTGNTYEFRMVVKKGIEQDQEYRDMAKRYAAEISDYVFGGARVDIHFCDDNFKTLAVIPRGAY